MTPPQQYGLAKYFLLLGLLFARLSVSSAFVPGYSRRTWYSHYPTRTIPSDYRPGTLLRAIDRNSTTVNNKRSFEVVVSDPRLLACDIVSIALAAQLLGLVDVLNDAEFYKNGGWFQPIFSADQKSTLPILVQRDSILSICWILSALGWKGYSSENNNVVFKTLQITAGFVALRVGIAFLTSSAGHVDMDLWDTIRQCYFTALVVGSFRFLYSQYFL